MSALVDPRGSPSAVCSPPEKLSRSERDENDGAANVIRMALTSSAQEVRKLVAGRRQYTGVNGANSIMLGLQMIACEIRTM
ncbi:hypothetical protein NM688_g3693 [Phlebia brevispora]|uniref:Uncharacterized protein n=1 Tax=Phlebia brevispora TaxID=194682 RepID=A0ACC1T570_9APHY|nr:hypothetical protein NM688_g3693 [Phlebia brevispora]